METDDRPYASPEAEASAVLHDNPRRRSFVFRIVVGLVHAFVGFITAVLALFHLCERGVPWFETYFLCVVPSVCFLLVLCCRRYRFAFAGTIVLLFVVFHIGQFYLYIIHHP